MDVVRTQRDHWMIHIVSLIFLSHGVNYELPQLSIYMKMMAMMFHGVYWFPCKYFQCWMPLRVYILIGEQQWWCCGRKIPRNLEGHFKSLRPVVRLSCGVGCWWLLVTTAGLWRSRPEIFFCCTLWNEHRNIHYYRQSADQFKWLQCMPLQLQTPIYDVCEGFWRDTRAEQWSAPTTI